MSRQKEVCEAEVGESREWREVSILKITKEVKEDLILIIGCTIGMTVLATMSINILITGQTPVGWLLLAFVLFPLIILGACLSECLRYINDLCYPKMIQAPEDPITIRGRVNGQPTEFTFSIELLKDNKWLGKDTPIVVESDVSTYVRVGDVVSVKGYLKYINNVFYICNCKVLNEMLQTTHRR